MTTTNQVVNSVVQFPYSSIQFLADSNQYQHLSDECIKHLTLETTGIVRFLLQVSGKKPSRIFHHCFFYRMLLNSHENVDEQKC
jgi:hypothetical protein